jgi:hypothetical protein
MTDFNYKKYLTENKLTQTTKLRAGILAEGQFSWMTQDTGQQIGSQDENQIPVYMFDDKGKYYYENDYEGYGVFGGMDYYELLDQMNGGEGDRGRGIDLAFGKEKTSSEVLFPALVTKPDKFNYKSHNFTQEPESDPNQSWYTPEEDDFYDQNDEEEYGDNEDEDDDMMEGLNEGKMYFHVLEDGGYGDIGHQGVYDTKEEAQNRANTLSDMFPKSEFYVEAYPSKKEPVTVTMEGKKKYYKDAEADDAEHIKALEKDMKDDKKSSKMKKSDLKAKIKEMVLSEMNITEDTFAPESEEDFLAEVDDILAEASEFDKAIAPRVATFIKSLDILVDEYHAELYLSDDLYNAIEMVKKAAKDVVNSVNEADEVAVDDTEVAVDGKENIDVDTTIQVDPNVKAVQDALTQAQAAAQKLGDPKLTDQIGNTITFFTRAHVVEKGAVAEADETTLSNLQYVLDWWEELPFEKKKEIFHQSHEAEDAAGKYKINEVEGKLVDEKTGKEVTLPYETLDFRGDPMTVISFRAPHKPSSTGRIYTKGGGEYFPSVAGLKIIDHSFSEDLNESMFPMLKKILK